MNSAIELLFFLLLDTTMRISDLFLKFKARAFVRSYMYQRTELIDKE